MGQDLVKSRLSGSDLIELLPIQKALGRLPHGRVGDLCYSNMSLDADAFVKKIEGHFKGRPLQHVDVDYSIDDFRIVGRIDTVYEGGHTLIQYSKTNPKYLLKTWIYHLILCKLVEGNIPGESYLICKDAAWKFSPVIESREMIHRLLDFYWIGMSKPLHFFPESSFIFAQNAVSKGQPKDAALRSAKNRWLGSEFSRGESADPYFERCFGKTDPLDESFQDIAKQIFSPLLIHRTKIQTLFA